MSSRTHSIKIVVVAILILSVMTGLGARLVYLHLGENAELKQRISKLRHIERIILVGRGRILDRKGDLLAIDLPVKDIFADPKVVQETNLVRFTAAHLSRLLEVDRTKLQERLNKPNRRFEYVKRYVKQDDCDRVAGLQLPGIHFETASARNYPQGRLAAQVLGFSNWDGIGSAGVEQHFDRYLKGRPGLNVSQKDGKRRELYDKRFLEIPPQLGSDLFLTIDQNVQFMVEEAMDRAMKEHSAKGVWVIVQRVKTGEILAMGSRPTYNLNEFRDSTLEERRNRTIGFTYEPGSTFKVAVIAAALNEKIVTPETKIDCENGMWYYRGRPLRDFHPYGVLTVKDVLKKSSNIGAAKIAIMLGNKRLEDYIRSFGFGEVSGIDLPGEEHGIFWSRRKWSAISNSRIAMGHEVAVTALQMLNAVCAIANDGKLMRPYVVRQVVNAKGDAIRVNEPTVRKNPISPQTARTMQWMMERVTDKPPNGGTGWRARVDGYSVGGKTGTAQKPVRGGYSDDANIASFTGFIPAENPALGIIVVVDEPQPIHTGGRVAGPVFKEIAEQAVRYLDIPPAVPRDNLKFVKHKPNPTLVKTL